MKTKLLICLLLIFAYTSNAQSADCACCNPEYKQFDFWIGDWEVFNEKNEKIGENLVLKLEDNCIVNENWVSVNGMTGKSYNYYDPKDGTWNQLWISNTGNVLKLKGSGGDNKMILKSELTQGSKGGYYNQISWMKNEDGSVTQLWETFDPNGEMLSNIFKGIYRLKESD